MPTAKLLSERPLVEIDEDGLRVLKRALAVDVGQYIKALHRKGRQRYHVSMSKMGTTITRVPEGMRYNGASIPWLVQPVLGDPMLWEAAGAVHDWLFQVQAPYRASNRVFRIIARSGKGVGWLRAGLAYAGLQLGGWVAYRRHGRKRKTV